MSEPVCLLCKAGQVKCTTRLEAQMSDPKNLHYFRVSTESVVRQRHSRIIVAETEEQALRQYELGTAWPESYDTSHLETIVAGQTEVTIDDREDVVDFADPKSHMMWRTFLANELKDKYPYPEPDEETEKFLSRGGDDEFSEPCPSSPSSES